jgi:hypothetical protein
MADHPWPASSAHVWWPRPLPDRRSRTASRLTPPDGLSERGGVPPRCLVAFTPQTGLRMGEVFGVTREKVDFLRRELHVTVQLLPDGTTGP